MTMRSRKWQAQVVLLPGLLLLIAVGLTRAQGPPTVEWWTIASGGEHAEAGNYGLDGTIGQPLVGEAESDPFKLCSGFDCGVGEISIETIAEPEVDCTLVYTDTQGNHTTVYIPAKAVDRTTEIAFTPVSTTTVPSGFAFGNHAFDLSAYQNGEPIHPFTFGHRIVVTIEYSDDDVAGLLEGTLALYRWTGSEWEEIGTQDGESYTVDTENNLLTAYLLSISRFGDMGVGIESWIYLPVVLRNG
jgi:hypothetical protein